MPYSHLPANTGRFRLSGTDNQSDTPSPAADSGAARLVLLLRFFGMPGDVESIRHEFGEADKPLETGDLP